VVVVILRDEPVLVEQLGMRTHERIEQVGVLVAAAQLGRIRESEQHTERYDTRNDEYATKPVIQLPSHGDVASYAECGVPDIVRR
jgi:hypothetical protein